MDDQKTAPYFEMPIDNGTTLVVEDIDELIAWVKRERDFWEWSEQARNRNIGLAEDHRGMLRNHLGTAWSLLHSPKEAGSPNLGGVRAALEQYAKIGLVSDSPRAEFVSGLRTRLGDEAATAAIAQFTSSAWSAGQTVPREWRHKVDLGRVAAQLFELGLGDSVNDAYNAASQKMSATFKSRMDRYGVEGRKEIAGLRAEREQANTDRQAWTEKASAEWKEMLDRVKTEVAASIEGISNTENAFKEQMKLRSSVRYWRDKAKEHRNRAHLQKFYIGAYAVVVAVIAYMVLPGFFAFVKTTAIELGEGSSTPLLILTGAGILAASIALWIARMLVRVYLEERHRALDADERAVMAETYCALTHEALVSETERVLVLSSLFRPSGEGTNKEDGPDTMQHAILAKLLDGKAAKV